MRIAAVVVMVVALFACSPEVGPAGPPGPPGNPGGGLAEWSGCTTSESIASSVLALDYQRYDFADGSVMTECAVRDGFYEYSSMGLYKASQTAAIQGTCVLAYDVDSPSLGQWHFTLPRGDVRATADYIDGPSPYNTRRATLPCDRH